MQRLAAQAAALAAAWRQLALLVVKHLQEVYTSGSALSRVGGNPVQGSQVPAAASPAPSQPKQKQKQPQQKPQTLKQMQKQQRRELKQARKEAEVEEVEEEEDGNFLPQASAVQLEAALLASWSNVHQAVGLLPGTGTLTAGWLLHLVHSS